MYKYESIEDSIDFLISSLSELTNLSDTNFQKNIIKNHLKGLIDLQKNISEIYSSVEHDERIRRFQNSKSYNYDYAVEAV